MGCAFGSRKDGARTDRAVRLENGLRGRLSLGGIAEDLGHSPWALIRAFEGRYDMTPGAYLQSLRVNRARALLRQGENPA